MHLAPLIRDLAVILGVAAVVTFIFRRIKQPVVLGYLMAGLIVGPHAPAFFSVSDLPNVKVWAELGIIFLMFALGLEFSFKKLARVGVPSVVTGVIEIGLMIVVGYRAGKLLGWSTPDSIFLGCMIAISSTTIIVKTLDELGLKARQFAETVLGILIVEDLVAILILVALSSFALSSSLSGLELAAAAAQLAFVVGVWVIIGLFAVPRFVRSVGRHGNDEMLTVVSLGLCLSLVAISASLNYSVALGAFTMGSILAESGESHRIEQLVKPLRDTFAAIFFVSVGMLIDPRAILAHWDTILVLSAVLMTGKVATISFGSLVAGAPLGTALQTGFSMAQIGEFSFIIATLGMSYNVISAELYPVIVAVSLLTTFTTPYMIRTSMWAAEAADRRLPPWLRQGLETYRAWMQRREAEMTPGRPLRRVVLRWGACAIVVIAVFAIVGKTALPLFRKQWGAHASYASLGGWTLAMMLAAPFVYAMLMAFRQYTPESGAGFRRFGALFASRLATIVMIGLLSSEILAGWLAILLTLGAALAFYRVFGRQLDGFYAWVETEFQASLGNLEAEVHGSELPHHLAPWDARLAKVDVHANSELAGCRLDEIKLRERHGVNVVAINRGNETVVAPRGEERIFPGDELLLLGSETQVEPVRAVAERPPPGRMRRDEFERYKLRAVTIVADSPLVGRTLRESRIRETHRSLVVGIERGAERVLNPKSDLALQAGDLLWVVGSAERVAEVAVVASQAPERLRP
jgi:CPA2 family monovalent cation:H+ antiporter-2